MLIGIVGRKKNVQYRDDIDGLRAVAVILIVFYHLNLNAVPGGFIGVDVFFVISGYLITTVILRESAANSFSYRSFYMRRLRRLGPALLATVALTLAAAWFLFPPAMLQTTGQSALATIFSVSNIYFWQETGYFDLAADYKPLLHTWSLAVEEQFYLIWPALLLIGARFLSRNGLLIGIAILSVISLLASQALIGKQSSVAFYMTPFRMFEFAVGIILAITGWQARNRTIAELSSLFGLMIILFVATRLEETSPFPGINAAIPALAAGLLIYAGPNAVMNRVIALGPVRYIGQISYSVYLVHWPISVFYLFLFRPAESVPQILVLLAVMLIAGALMYHTIETPFRRKSANRFVISSQALGWSSALVAIVLSLTSWQIHREKGYPARFEAEMAEMLAELAAAIEDRAHATGEWDCNASDNSVDVYFSEFENCVSRGPDRAIVVLGDSHAADVFVGLKAAYPDRSFVQLTGNGCNFSWQVDGGVFCRPFEEHWSRWLKENADRIDAVIYSQSRGSLFSKAAYGLDVPDTASFAPLNERLMQFKVDDVPLIFWGPRPAFQPTIDIAIVRSETREKLSTYFSDTDYGADVLLDAELLKFFANTPVHYVSSVQPLCKTTCPTLTKDNQLYVVDFAHWSVPGAIEAVRTVVGSDPVLQSILHN